MQITNITSNRTTEIQHFAAMCAFDAYGEGMRCPIPGSSLPEKFYRALDAWLGRKAIPNESTSFYITFERALGKRNGMSDSATHWDNNVEQWREPTEEERIAARWNEAEDGSRFWVCDDPLDHPGKFGVVDEVAGGVIEFVDTDEEAARRVRALTKNAEHDRS